MGDFQSVATPNEIFTYYKKIQCKLCGSALDVRDESFRFADEYYGDASCSNHYTNSIWWKDPKHINVEADIFDFSFNEVEYSVRLQFINSGIYLSDTATIIVDGIKFETEISFMLDVLHSEELMAKRINTVMLLK